MILFIAFTIRTIPTHIMLLILRMGTTWERSNSFHGANLYKKYYISTYFTAIDTDTLQLIYNMFMVEHIFMYGIHK